jgi:hypothetical protein
VKSELNVVDLLTEACCFRETWTSVAMAASESVLMFHNKKKSHGGISFLC